MGWKENLFQNLITITILLVIGLTIYCKIAKKTLGELIIQIREAMASPIENE